MKKFLTVTLTAALLLVLAACGTFAEAPGEGERYEGAKTFVFAQAGDPVILNPGLHTDNMSAEVTYLAQTLLFRNIADEFVPDGATHMEISNDGMTITFHLREGLVWADGEPLTAEHYALTLRHILSPDTANPNAVSYFAIAGAAAFNAGEIGVGQLGVSVPDDRTLEVQLERPSPAMLDMVISLAPMRQDLLDEHGQGFGASAEAYLSSGPFILETWDFGQQLIFTRNPLFWNSDEVNLTQLTWVTVLDANTRLNLFETGEVHLFSGNDENVAAFSDMDIVTASAASGNQLQLNFYNPANPEAGRVLANYNFRMALLHALDRQAIIQTIQGSAQSATSRLISEHVPTERGPWDEAFPFSMAPHSGDAPLSVQYLETALTELGFASAADLPEFNFLLFEVPVHRLFAEAMVDSWQQVLGVMSFNYVILPIPQAIGAAMSGDFDIYLQGLGRSRDPFNGLQGLMTGGIADWSDWAGRDTFTEMLIATNMIADPFARHEALFEAEQFLAQYGVMLPLWTFGSHYIINTSVGLTGLTTSVFWTGTGPLQFVYVDVIPAAQRE
jgi:oligopeptide transport system substrate-binding protein